MELNYSTIKNVPFVNKLWNKIYNDNVFWHDKIIKDFGTILFKDDDHKQQYLNIYAKRYQFLDDSVVPFDANERIQQMVNIYIDKSRVLDHDKNATLKAGQRYKNNLLQYKQSADILYNKYILTLNEGIAINSISTTLTCKKHSNEYYTRDNEDEYMFRYNAWYTFLHYLVDHKYMFKEEAKRLTITDFMEGTLYIWHFVVTIQL